jgi:hypothetical protein
MSTVYTPSRRSMMADIDANANPNNPFTSHIVKGGATASSPVEEKVAHVPYDTVTPAPSKFGALGSAYRSVSWILGFKERFSLVLFIFFGGALVGFCLARTKMMSPYNVRTLTIAGEWYWYSKPLYKPNLFIHIYLTIIAGILAVFQFLPAIRRRAVIVHRINGYIVLALLIPGIVCGTIVGRPSFGGELNSQSAYYCLGSMIVVCAILGYTNVKQTRKHRKWMLRTVALTGAPITTRLCMIAARKIITHIGTYYAVWRCDEIVVALQSTFPPTPITEQPYVQCIEPGVNQENTFIPVLAAVKKDTINFASSVRVTFGMALWIAMLVHVIGVEYYIRMTESSNQHRRGFVLERLSDEDEEARVPDDR